MEKWKEIVVQETASKVHFVHFLVSIITTLLGGRELKKITLIFLLMIFLATSTAQALSWAYPFVVWSGNVYKVTTEEVKKNEVSKRIGEVKTKPNDMTGKYYGNASNEYPEGTQYFAISGISTDTAIAVEEKKEKYVKAVFVNKATSHWNPYYYFILFVVAIVLFSFLGKKNIKA